MELITKKNITVDKLRSLFSSGIGCYSTLFHLATKKGILTVNLSMLSSGTCVIKSPRHSDSFISMATNKSMYLHGTLGQLVEWFKDGAYNVVVRKTL